MIVAHRCLFSMFLGVLSSIILLIVCHYIITPDTLSHQYHLTHCYYATTWHFQVYLFFTDSYVVLYSYRHHIIIVYSIHLIIMFHNITSRYNTFSLTLCHIMSQKDTCLLCTLLHCPIVSTQLRNIPLLSHYSDTRWDILIPQRHYTHRIHSSRKYRFFTLIFIISTSICHSYVIHCLNIDYRLSCTLRHYPAK